MLSYLQATWNALCGKHRLAADDPSTTYGNVLIINQEIREAWLAIRDACHVTEGFWDFLFEQADHGHLPDDMITLDVDGRTLMKGRWFRRAKNFRQLVEPLAMANLAYVNVNADYSELRPGRFVRIENMGKLNANAVPKRNVQGKQGPVQVLLD